MPNLLTPERIYEMVRAVLAESIDDINPEKITINSHLANDLGASGMDFPDTYLRLAGQFPAIRTKINPFSVQHAETDTVESICKTIADIYSIEWITPELAHA